MWKGRCRGVPAQTGDMPDVDQVMVSADHAAAAALRELPEALMLVFDRDLRFVLTAGPRARAPGQPAACRAGRACWRTRSRAALWALMEPLFRSALEGETRSREIWTAEQRHCLMVDVGPLR